ncbi:hypothetical protein HX005_02450 [Acinetobacter sp. R933-2]|uniref:hypothetical protein n=1 Tax=Acinetobacter sp. R933-2 TaxID=2746728 RepID=UPI002576ABFB|nr:hypothetical protein [Acinetobacter sp. R933-2]MDM1246259.1 hypothetical protein [Acinetobacter sp. R933-2]
MFHITEEILKIQNTHFFKNMGHANFTDQSIVFIKNIESAFIYPQESDFKNIYHQVKWLPTSLSETDPFYTMTQRPPELIIILRKQITQALMQSIRTVDPQLFKYDQYDFQYAAKNALCFAFRQALIEKYYGLGQHWEKITELYYLGHWVIGYTTDQYIVI